MMPVRGGSRNAFDYAQFSQGGSMPILSMSNFLTPNLSMYLSRWSMLVAALGLTVISTPVGAEAGVEGIGRIKVVKGEVSVERDGKTFPGIIGTELQQADKVKTGADGSVGITMADDSLLSAGPNSQLSLDRYAFDPTTRQGQFDASLQKGSLAVISGRIAKQSPDAMKVRTPTSILGVRGTEFVVSVDE